MDGNFNNYTQQGNYIPPKKESVSGLAIAAFVCGIVGLVLQIFPCSIVALILGSIARKNPQDKTFATVGMSLGLVQIILFLLGIVVAIIYFVGGFLFMFLTMIGSM